MEAVTIDFKPFKGTDFAYDDNESARDNLRRFILCNNLEQEIYGLPFNSEGYLTKIFCEQYPFAQIDK